MSRAIFTVLKHALPHYNVGYHNLWVGGGGHEVGWVNVGMVSIGYKVIVQSADGSLSLLGNEM